MYGWIFYVNVDYVCILYYGMDRNKILKIDVLFFFFVKEIDVLFGC